MPWKRRQVRSQLKGQVPHRSKSRTRVPIAQILEHLGPVVAVFLEVNPYLECDLGNRSLQTERVRSRCSTWNSEQFRGDALPQGVRLPVAPMLFEIHGWLTNQSFPKTTTNFSALFKNNITGSETALEQTNPLSHEGCHRRR